MTGPTLEVCFSPALMTTLEQIPGRNVVVVDILRASTAITTAFGYGAASVVPVVNRKEALAMKEQGWLVAGEEDGIKLPFADFGNSPLEFRNDSIKGKDIVFSTTNGIKAINIGKKFGKVLVASFVNLEAVCGWLSDDRNDVVILCAGWKDSFSLEDAIFAGAMADLLVNAYGFLPLNDSSLASITLWNHSAKSLMKNVSRSSHYLRLLGIENRKGLKYCFFPEKFHVVPMLVEGKLVDLRFS
ncbi:MAG: 2-phosphosulfolactate phosphatase [Bacteroidales bacterium]|nr:2-phosphosulfolactate phosphatase [Bacteroidales bacterium]